MGKRNFVDLTGQTFNRWTVVKLDETKTRRHWICRCKCEKHTIKSVREYDLIHNKNMSCGCLHKERTSASLTKHGQSKTKLYRTWQNMKKRCYNEKGKDYVDYGGRGITVCKEWLNNFEAFSEWAYKNGYNSKAEYGDCTIDRIDVNGNYCPENCRWTNELVQANNKTNNRFIEYKNATKTLSEWCRELDLPYSRTLLRLNRGWDISKAFEEPEREKVFFDYKGEKWSIEELSAMSGVPKKLLRSRLCRDKIPVEEALKMTKNNTSVNVGQGVKTENGQYILTYNGLSGNSTYWEGQTGIKRATIRARAKRGLGVKDCLKEFTEKEKQ